MTFPNIPSMPFHGNFGHHQHPSGTPASTPGSAAIRPQASTQTVVLMANKPADSGVISQDVDRGYNEFTEFQSNLRRLVGLYKEQHRSMTSLNEHRIQTAKCYDEMFGKASPLAGIVNLSSPEERRMRKNRMKENRIRENELAMPGTPSSRPTSKYHQDAGGGSSVAVPESPFDDATFATLDKSLGTPKKPDAPAYFQPAGKPDASGLLVGDAPSPSSQKLALLDTSLDSAQTDELADQPRHSIQSTNQIIIKDKFEQGPFQQKAPQEEQFHDNKYTEEPFQDKSSQKKDLQDSPSQKKDFQDNSFEKKDLQDNSFEKEDFQEESFEKEDFQDNSFEKEDFQDNSFEKEDFQVESFEKEDIQVESFEKEDFQEEKETIIEDSSEKEAIKEDSSEKETIKEDSSEKELIKVEISTLPDSPDDVIDPNDKTGTSGKPHDESSVASNSPEEPLEPESSYRVSHNDKLNDVTSCSVEPPLEPDALDSPDDELDSADKPDHSHQSQEEISIPPESPKESTLTDNSDGLGGEVNATPAINVNLEAKPDASGIFGGGLTESIPPVRFDEEAKPDASGVFGGDLAESIPPDSISQSDQSKSPNSQQDDDANPRKPTVAPDNMEEAPVALQDDSLEFPLKQVDKQETSDKQLPSQKLTKDLDRNSNPPVSFDFPDDEIDEMKLAQDSKDEDGFIGFIGGEEDDFDNHHDSDRNSDHNEHIHEESTKGAVEKTNLAEEDTTAGKQDDVKSEDSKGYTDDAKMDEHPIERVVSSDSGIDGESTVSDFIPGEDGITGKTAPKELFEHAEIPFQQEFVDVDKDKRASDVGDDYRTEENQSMNEKNDRENHPEEESGVMTKTEEAEAEEGEPKEEYGEEDEIEHDEEEESDVEDEESEEEPRGSQEIKKIKTIGHVDPIKNIKVTVTTINPSLPPPPPMTPDSRVSSVATPIFDPDSYFDVHDEAYKESKAFLDQFANLIQYLEEWERVVSNRVRARMGEYVKLRNNLKHYEKKMDGLASEARKLKEKNKPMKPKQEERLERNQVKLTGARETHDSAGETLFLLIDEIVNRSWRDVYPLLKKAIHFEENYSAMQAKVFGKLNGTAELLERVGEKERISDVSRLHSLKTMNPEVIYTGPKGKGIGLPSLDE